MAKAAKAAKVANGKSHKSITKTEFYNRIATATDLKKTEIAKVFDAVADIITKELSVRGPGVVTLPGLFKLKAKRIPAKKAKAGEMTLNRFTGESKPAKDKPASVRVRALPLKSLKDRVK